MYKDLLVWQDENGEWKHEAFVDYMNDHAVEKLYARDEIDYPVYNVCLETNTNYSQYYIFESSEYGFEVSEQKDMPNEVLAIALLYGS